MKLVYYYLFFFILLQITKANHVERFYEMLENPGTVSLNIKYTQSQFGNVFESVGVCYFINSDDYLYQSAELEIYAQVDQIITKNFKTRQIIYNSINKNHFSLMNVLLGNRDQIKFIDNYDRNLKYQFTISQLGLDGYFSFNAKTGLIQSLNLETGENQSISIEIISMDILEGFSMPKLNIENFEIIDLRG